MLILGAGFGGLELATTLAETPGGGFDVVLVDRSDAFVFGYSKLDVMFGRATLDAVRLPYSEFAHPGVRLVRETVTAIDPEARRVTTDAASTKGTCSSSRSAPTTTSPARRASPSRAKSSTPSTARNACGACCRRSRAGA